MMRIVWQTVRRIIDEILVFYGLIKHFLNITNQAKNINNLIVSNNDYFSLLTHILLTIEEKCPLSLVTFFIAKDHL